MGGDRDQDKGTKRRRSRTPDRADRDKDRNRDRDRDRDRDRGDRGRDRDRDRDRGSERSKRSRDDDDEEMRDREKERKDEEQGKRLTDKERKKLEVDKERKEKQRVDEAKKVEEAKQDFLDFQKALQTHTTLQQQTPTPAATKGDKKAVPVSINTLQQIAKTHQEEENANLKPVFLSKKARQELEAKQQEDDAQDQKKDDDEKERQRREFERAARREARQGSSSSYEARRREREKTKEQRDKEKEERDKTKDERDGEKKSQLIKDQYLGKKVTKKRIIPPSQKFKFSFDWEATDDTSADLNPLYSKKHAGALLYGRGFVGGVDRRAQKKQYTFYTELLKSRTDGPEEDVRDMDKVAARTMRKEQKEQKSELMNRHWSEKPLEYMGERDWRIFKEDFNIATRGPRCPHPLRFWKEGNFPPEIMSALEKAGYEAPTPIQRAAIPVGLANIDVVGIAETGSGKTCAFLIPMLIYISKQPKLTQITALDGPYAIIMAPTRELAQQISSECDKFAKSMGIKAVSIVGGVSMEDQGFAMRDGAEVVIATPGRLYDCIDKRYLVLNQCNYVVLDEADRMIDVGFEPQIIKILECMQSTNLKPEKEEDVDVSGDKIYRQTIMFSATMPPKVELLAKKYLRHPVFIAIGDRKGKTNEMIEQRIEFLKENQKRDRLLEILRNDQPPFMVFCNAKKNCDSLCRQIEAQGVAATVIHGGKIQDQRESNLEGFKNGTYDVLVATDVVGRGIDISGVQQVINYDMPTDIQRYTHRIGRTGRAGMRGIATSFITEQDTDIFYDLTNLLKQNNIEIPRELANHEASKTKPTPQAAGKFGGKKRDMDQ